MKMVSKMLLIAAIVVVSGCGGSTQKFTRVNVPAGKSVIYVYRKAGMVLGVANDVYLFANQRCVTRMTNGGYYAYVTEPGEVEIKSQHTIFQNVSSPARIPICKMTAAAGQDYFLEYNVLNPSVKNAGSEKGLAAIKNLHLCEDLLPESRRWEKLQKGMTPKQVLETLQSKVMIDFGAPRLKADNALNLDNAYKIVVEEKYGTLVFEDGVLSQWPLLEQMVPQGDYGDAKIYYYGGNVLTMDLI